MSEGAQALRVPLSCCLPTPVTRAHPEGAALTSRGWGPGGQRQGLRQRRIREQNAGQVLWD